MPRTTTTTTTTTPQTTTTLPTTLTPVTTIITTIPPTFTTAELTTTTLPPTTTTFPPTTTPTTTAPTTTTPTTPTTQSTSTTPATTTKPDTTTPFPLTTASTSTTSTPASTTTATTTATSVITTTTTSMTTGNSACYSNPCKNGGQCAPTGNTYRCNCAGGYTSNNCEIEINECDDLPCYPFGSCMDFVDNHTCTCLDGFRYVSSQYCSEIDECDEYRQSHSNESICGSRGTCVDIINGTLCNCLQNDPDNFIFGDHCEKKTPRVTFPTISAISKSSGIQAGGSAITVTGQALDLITPILVYLNGSGFGLDVLVGYVDQDSVQRKSFVFLTPKANESYVDIRLPMTVLLSGGQFAAMTQPIRFNYVENPTITNILPKEILATGGVKLNVVGSNLAAVGNPLMTATLKITYENETHNITITRSYEPQECANATDLGMLCPLPVFNLNTSDNSNTSPGGARRKKRNILEGFPSTIFTQAFHRLTSFLLDQPSARLVRNRRDKPISSFPIDNKTDGALFLKFTLDSYPKYENLSKALPNVSLSLVNTRPEFKSGSNQKQQSFDSSKHENVTIQGDNLITGLTKFDYVVNVGNGSCNVTDVTDNELKCVPPTQKPDDGIYTQQHCRDYPEHLAVMVIAAKQYEDFAFCIKYTNSETPDSQNIFLIIGLCVGIGGSFLLMFAIILAVVIHRRRRRRRPKPSTPRPRRRYVDEEDTGANERELSEHSRNFPSDDMRDHSMEATGTSIYTGRLGNPDDRSIRRHPKTRPYGAFSNFAKRISWTRPNRENDEMFENSDNKYVFNYPKVNPRRPNPTNTYQTHGHDLYYSRNGNMYNGRSFDVHRVAEDDEDNDSQPDYENDTRAGDYSNRYGSNTIIRQQLDTFVNPIGEPSGQSIAPYESHHKYSRTVGDFDGATSGQSHVPSSPHNTRHNYSRTLGDLDADTLEQESYAVVLRKDQSIEDNMVQGVRKAKTTTYYPPN